MITLILGGARSGKSRFAEKLATETNLCVVYVATATPSDNEMSLRINNHRKKRSKTWTTVEEPLAIARVIKNHCHNKCIIVDCLTLWITNLLLEPNDDRLSKEKKELMYCLNKTKSDILLVSNETNSGVIPIDPLSRRFCDEIGFLHQEIADIADNVILMVAGLPHTLKGVNT
tara:strand:+ start:433 stop:951 length:519 start_codon:yes stop_codon:yes gene_type:complete